MLASGLEADTVNAYKSTAGAAAFVAISEFYRGVATLEVIDMTKVTPSGAGASVGAEERAKLSEAVTHFRAAAEALSRAVEVCSKFRAKVPKPEGHTVLDCDSGGLERLREIVARIAAAKDGALPVLEDVEAAMSAINDDLASWRSSTEAARGLPGHYPAKATPHP